MSNHIAHISNDIKTLQQASVCLKETDEKVYFQDIDGTVKALEEQKSHIGEKILKEKFLINKIEKRKKIEGMAQEVI